MLQALLFSLLRSSLLFIRGTRSNALKNIYIVTFQLSWPLARATSINSHNNTCFHTTYTCMCFNKVIRRSMPTVHEKNNNGHYSDYTHYSHYSDYTYYSDYSHSDRLHTYITVITYSHYSDYILWHHLQWHHYIFIVHAFTFDTLPPYKLYPCGFSDFLEYRIKEVCFYLDLLLYNASTGSYCYQHPAVFSCCR